MECSQCFQSLQKTGQKNNRKKQHIIILPHLWNLLGLVSHVLLSEELIRFCIA